MSRGLAPREVEKRDTSSTVEIRSSNGGMQIGGYAAVYGKRSQPLGSFTEIVEPSAFSKTRGDGWNACVCRFEHDSRMLLGTVSAGTLQLSTDNVGLDYSVDLPQSRADVYELVQRGDIRSSSFSFQAYEQDWTYKDGTAFRHLVSVRLIDVSPVSNPAYPDATVALRSLALQFDAEPEDVFGLAREGELRRLFTATGIDGNHRPLTPRSPKQALLELMRVHPCAPPPTLGFSPAKARAELTRMRMPRPSKTMAQRRKELTDAAKPVWQIMSDGLG